MLTWIKILSIIFGVANCQPADNTKCPTVTEKAVTLRDLGGNRYKLELPNAAIIQRVSINTINCYPDRELLEKTHSLNYLDATDATMQDLVYSEVLYGSWGIDDNTIEIDLDPVIYTRHVVLATESPVQCSTITLHGCETDEICMPGTCGNVGKCVGNGRCACARGFIGEICEMEVSKMAVDDFSFVSPPIFGTLYTKDAAFDVIGETLFNILPVSQPSLIGKRSGHSGHSDHGGHSEHGNSCTFHGSGGSCSYSSSHNSGYTNNGHSTYGHDPSHSPTSCMSGQTNGYSHTATVSAGHDHHHGESNYIYTTHGTNHNSPGCSLQYGNGNLDMHVHHEHEEHHGHGDHHYQDNHYHVTVPFTPEPEKPYTITSSFSPNHGACVYINGNLAGSQTKPTSTHSHPDPHQGPPPAHCFGKCGAQSTGNNNNFTISNIAVAGGSVPTLTQNMLLGLLGSDMIQLLMQLQQKMLTTTAPTNSLQPLQVSSTLAPVPSSKPSSTTVLPSTTTTTSTQPPVTATTGHTPGNAATYGPVCFNCLRIANNGGCVNVTQCNVGDECLVFHDRDGYTYRCMSKTDCANGSQLPVSHCWNCCSDHYCNKQCTPTTTPPNQSGSSCQDDPQCAGLLNLGPYYDVCVDPAYSSTICQKSCKICP